MSNQNLDDELILEYLAESREHLATIEVDLLAVEQSGAEIDDQAVNRVFRAAHSIKGGAGFFDLVKIRELAHKTENALDLIRSRQMIPTPEIVSVLLLAFDKLRELIDHHRESNEADIDEFVSALSVLTADHLPDDQKRLANQKVAIPSRGHGIEVSALDLSQARRGGKSIYLVEYDLIHDVQRRGKTPLEVLRRLMRSGEILETAFDLESAGTLDDEPSNRLILEVLFATPLEPDLIGQLVEVPAERMHVVAKDGSAQKLGGNAPLREPAPTPAEEAKPVKAEVPIARTAPVVARPESEPKTPPAAPAPSAETTVRLNVALLDSLMTLAGELVLSRNQLNESLTRSDERGTRQGAQRISLVTSELQELVTLTRMQPAGNVFQKFPRLVRDLARELNKEIQLQIEGSDVEIDKTILEGLSDPLTHMVRNAVDHGIEVPEARLAAGKPAAGTVTLRAYHQAGQVVIEISDDGRGLDAERVAASAISKGLVQAEQAAAMPVREKFGLIFLPGVSTAKQVSNVSGRGVGMDVVKSNFDKLGGKIDIDSAPGRGTSFRIKLPLTLAIIPSLLVSSGGQRFAIPQVNVAELIRIPPAQIGERVNRVGNAEILILRDRLVPLLHLSAALGNPQVDYSVHAMNVVLVDTGAFEYGLIVEELHDTVEIVVKPLGRHFQGLADYAGATILGDGHVSLILDVIGIAQRAGLSAANVEALTQRSATEAAGCAETNALLLFENAPSEACALPIELVSRIERIRPTQVEYLAGRRTMQYRGASLPLVALEDAVTAGKLSEDQSWVVIVFEMGGHPLGLLAAEPLDMLETELALDTTTLRQTGIAGSAILKGRTTLVVNIFELAGAVRPEWGAAEPATQIASGAGPEKRTVLVAEDSDFFRTQIQKLVEAVGFRVLAAPDGQAAWELLEQHSDEVDVVATDVEMPRLDGLGLTRRIRADRRFAELPVIALSSLAGEEEIARGFAAGVSEYQVKLNPDELVQSIRNLGFRR
jgi:two-component system chemotaxis sensor kinase CheA